MLQLIYANQKKKKGVYGLLDNQFQVVIGAICGQ